MKDGLPTTYWVFRYSWSILHLVIVGLIALGILLWAITDNQGAQAMSAWWAWTNNLRDALSGLLPFPWSTL